MNPTVTEKLILQMLCDIHKRLDIQDSYDPTLISKALASDDYWVLDWAYDISEPGTPTPPHVTAVVDALDMYSFLKESFEALSPQQREALEAAVPNVAARIDFPGFDGNNEGRYRTAARYLVNELDRFESMKDVADRNSHTRMVDVYGRMVAVFEPIRDGLIDRLMNVDEIVQVLDARIHPANR